MSLAALLTENGVFTVTKKITFPFCCLPGIQYRIAGGSSNRGRIEVSYDGEWGTVCNRGFGWRAAAVFCRSLGLGFVDGATDHS